MTILMVESVGNISTTTTTFHTLLKGFIENFLINIHNTQPTDSNPSDQPNNWQHTKTVTTTKTYTHIMDISQREKEQERSTHENFSRKEIHCLENTNLSDTP